MVIESACVMAAIPLLIRLLSPEAHKKTYLINFGGSDIAYASIVSVSVPSWASSLNVG